MENPMTDTVQLRDVHNEDLPIFFDQQLDKEASYMAAFVPENTSERDGFNTRWTKILDNNNFQKKTILFNGQVAGNIMSFELFGTPGVGYWIGKEYWGKGIATKALSAFLDCEKTRPLYARAVKDNMASIRVLQKCGFKITGTDKGFANARGEEVEEVILRLDENS